MSRDHGSKQQQLRQLLQLIRGLGRRRMAVAAVFTLALWVCVNSLYVVHPARASTPAAALPNLKHSFPRMGPSGLNCSDHAASEAVNSAAAAVLKPKSRDLPKLDAGAPVLVASNWDGAAKEPRKCVPTQQLHATEQRLPWLLLKVVNVRQQGNSVFLHPLQQ